MLSINGKATGLRAVMWTILQNFEKVGNQFFLKGEEYFMCKTSHVKRELGLKDVTFYKGLI